MQIGLYNFGDSMPDAATGEQIDQGTRIRNVLEEIEVADASGLDVVALGEHHRPEFAISSPTTVLAAAATRTERIRLSLQLRAFNMLNQVSFGGPSVITVGQANFGSAGGVVDNARRAEVGAKLYF